MIYVPLHDRIAAFDKLVPQDARSEDFQRFLDTRLAKFEQEDREKLICMLRSAHDRAPKGHTFDEHNCWLLTTALARDSFARDWWRQQSMSNSERQARFRKIADALKDARELIEDAERTTPNIAYDVAREWLKYTLNWNEYDCVDDQEAEIEFSARYELEFEKAVQVTATLEYAATRAAESAHKERGRPKVAPEHIFALEELYKESTGLDPSAGPGPFARFVRQFLAAMDQHLSEDAVVDRIKCARRQSGHPKNVITLLP
jgi:hypothetical protein